MSLEHTAHIFCAKRYRGRRSHTMCALCCSLCVWVWLFVYVRVSTCTRVDLRVSMCVDLRVSMSVDVRVSMCVDVRVRMCVDVHVRECVNVHVRRRACEEAQGNQKAKGANEELKGAGRYKTWRNAEFHSCVNS